MREHASNGALDQRSRPLRLAVAPARKSLRRVPQIALVLDVAVMATVELVAALLRMSFDWFGGRLNDPTIVVAGPAILVSWILMLAAMGGYRPRLFGAGVEEFRTLITATLTTAGVVGVGCYVLKYDLSRGFFGLVFVVGSLALTAGRAALRRALQQARARGTLCHDVVIAGTPGHIDEISRVLSREKWLGYRVLGAILPPALPSLEVEETVSGTPVLGTTDRAIEVLKAVNADIIFIAGGALSGASQMRELVWELEAHDVQVVVAPSVTDVSRERIRIRPVAGLPLIHIDPPRHIKASRRAKRMFDLVFTTALIFAIAPVLLFISAWIKLSDRGPVLFRQTRIGRDGQEFSCLKFRTMVVDAEERLAELHAVSGFTGGLFKMKDDPRVTAPGQLLRRYSLDELPQLFNVLRGQMSLVGPRPPLPTEVAAYDRFTHRRLHVRPGMTGLWQVSGRSDLSWSEAVRLDLYYVDNWSMLQDMNILARTFGAVFGSKGAY